MALAFANSGCSVKGAPGRDGHDASVSPIGFVTPCYDPYKPLQESILVLSDGKLLGQVGHGNKKHLSVLLPGNYTTTDGYKCEYTITSQMNVVW